MVTIDQIMNIKIAQYSLLGNFAIAMTTIGFAILGIALGFLQSPALVAVKNQLTTLGAVFAIAGILGFLASSLLLETLKK